MTIYLYADHEIFGNDSLCRRYWHHSTFFRTCATCINEETYKLSWNKAVMLAYLSIKIGKINLVLIYMTIIR